MLSPVSASTKDDVITPTGSPLIQNTKFEDDIANKEQKVEHVKQDISVLTDKKLAKETASEKSDEENVPATVKVATIVQEQVGACATTKENERPSDSRAAKHDTVLLPNKNDEANKADIASTKNNTPAVPAQTGINADSAPSSPMKTEAAESEDLLITHFPEVAAQPESTTKEETLSSDDKHEGALLTAEVIVNADEASGPALQEAEVLSVSVPESHTDTDPSGQEATVAALPEENVQVGLKICIKLHLAYCVVRADFTKKKCLPRVHTAFIRTINSE